MEDVDFSEFCKTKAQANDFATRISSISAQIFLTNFNLEHALTEHLGLRKKDKLIMILREKNVNTSSGSDLKTFFSKVQEYISKLPVLSMIVAIEPKDKTLKMLSDWFFLNKQRQVLFDLIYDPNLIGGAAIAYKGKYLDYSIKPLFTKVLSEALTPPTTTVKPNEIREESAS